LRELLAWMFKLKRDKTIADVAVYLLWVVLYSIVVAMVVDVHQSWTASQAIWQGLADEEVPEYVLVEGGGVWRESCHTYHPPPNRQCVVQEEFL
jgi:vancomycin permeability regulator SanA